jgi:CIC family chloride channel protein
MREFNRLVDRYRLSVARHDAVPQLALLGILAGLLAGATIIAFRLLVAWLHHGLTAGQQIDRYELLPPHYRFLLPLGAGLAIGLLFHFLPAHERRVGILHILERLAYHQGTLPWRNGLVQFIGGTVALACGHSVGREAPSAHLGAAASNLPAQGLRLPHNSLRVTAACGAAAGIAASFNTPLAGVAFAMEVLMMEYTVAGFAPVILAAVSATMLTRSVFGPHLAFTVPEVSLGTLVDLPYIMLAGIAIGLLGAAFVVTIEWLVRHSQRMPVWLAFSLAGAVVGLCGLAVPAVMGVGDHTITETLQGSYAFELLLLILGLKIVASAACIGAGIPGGIIGPSLVIGAAAGALFALLGASLGITDGASFTLYALTGMGAMMAAILQAPLAGLIAVLELSGHPNVILPGMLGVVSATIAAGFFTRRESVFQGRLRQLGLDYRNDPVTQSLRRIGVAAVMERAVATLPRQVDREQAESALADNPHWILVREPAQSAVILAAVDLVRALRDEPETARFDLRQLPAQRLQAEPIDLQASLQEAHQRVRETGAEALYVARITAPGIERVFGILTPEGIEKAYRH